METFIYSKVFYFIMYIEREIYGKIESELSNKNITALVGSRQVGKTTLMKKLFKTLSNSEFITFEDIDILGLFENNIKLFIKRLPR